MSSKTSLKILNKLIEYFEWNIDDDLKDELQQQLPMTFDTLNNKEKLFYYCINNNLDGFKQLFDHMSMLDQYKSINLLNIKDKNSNGFLHICSLCNYKSFAKYLLNKEYLSYKINVNITDFDGSNPGHWCCISNNYDILNMLIKNGLDLSIKHYNKTKDNLYVVVRQMPVYIIGNKSYLHYCCEFGSFECLKLLLNTYIKHNEYKYYINLKDSNGYSCMDLCLLNIQRSDTYIDCIKMLNEYPYLDYELNDDIYKSILKSNKTLNINKYKIKRFNRDYYRTQERIAMNFKDTLPGMHGNCCDTCKDMYKIADKNQS